MAYAPEGAEVIKTAHSIVPGYRMDNVFVMAGVPRIMRLMLDSIVDTLKIGSAILNSSVHANVSEGEIAAVLEDIQQQHPDVDIGSYPQEPDSIKSNYRVIFVVRGTDQNQINKVCEKILSACTAGGFEAVSA